jgi:hypothetical protein
MCPAMLAMQMREVLVDATLDINSLVWFRSERSGNFGFRVETAEENDGSIFFVIQNRVPSLEEIKSHESLAGA